MFRSVRFSLSFFYFFASLTTHKANKKRRHNIYWAYVKAEFPHVKYTKWSYSIMKVTFYPKKSFVIFFSPLCLCRCAHLSCDCSSSLFFISYEFLGDTPLNKQMKTRMWCDMCFFIESERRRTESCFRHFDYNVDIENAHAVLLILTVQDVNKNARRIRMWRAADEIKRKMYRSRSNGC